MTYWVTTNPGLESFVIEEIKTKSKEKGMPEPVCSQEVYGLGGYLGITYPLETNRKEIESTLYSSRRIHHIIRPILLLTFSDEELLLEELCNYLRDHIDIPAIREAETFRVSTLRQGDHPFTSLDVQRRIGEVYHERYGTPVDLSNPDCHIRADVVGKTVIIGKRLTSQSLSYRLNKPFHPRVTLRPNIANCLLACSHPKKGETILDPFCGSGTLLIEGKLSYPETEFIGMEIDQEMVTGAKTNLEANGINTRIINADALQAKDFFEENSIDAIVTNPPYGLRLSRKKDFALFYDRFLDVAYHLLRPGGKLVLLIMKRGIFFKIASQHKQQFSISFRRVLEMGDTYPCLVVLTRKD